MLHRSWLRLVARLPTDLCTETVTQDTASHGSLYVAA